ncbi:hypothetical protein MMC10_001119 [Thelotrema lepadinum]|nr:hypothetical protein [Thelotrema lepadinum]
MDSFPRSPSFGSLAGARKRGKIRLFAKDPLPPTSRTDSELVDLTQNAQKSPRSKFRLGALNSASLGEDGAGTSPDTPLYGSLWPDLPESDSTYSNPFSRARRDVLPDKGSSLLQESGRPTSILSLWQRTQPDNAGPADQMDLAMEDAPPRIKEEPVDYPTFKGIPDVPSILFPNLDALPTRPTPARVNRVPRPPSSSTTNIGSFNLKQLRKTRLPTPSIPSMSGISSSVADDGALEAKKKQQSTKKASVAKMGRGGPIGNVPRSKSTSVSSEQRGSRRRRGESISSAISTNNSIITDSRPALADGSSPYHIYSSTPPTFVPDGDTEVLDMAGLVLLTTQEKCPWGTRQPISTSDTQSLYSRETNERDWSKGTGSSDAFTFDSSKVNQSAPSGIATPSQQANGMESANSANENAFMVGPPENNPTSSNGIETSDRHETCQSEPDIFLHSEDIRSNQPLQNSTPAGAEIPDAQDAEALSFGEVEFDGAKVAGASNEAQAQTAVPLPLHFQGVIPKVHDSHEPEVSRSQRQCVDNEVLLEQINHGQVETSSLSTQPRSSIDLGPPKARSLKSLTQVGTLRESVEPNLSPTEIKRRKKNEASRSWYQRQKAKNPEGFRLRMNAYSKHAREKKRGGEGSQKLRKRRIEDIQQRVADIDDFITSLSSSDEVSADDSAIAEERQSSGEDGPEIEESIWLYYARTAVEGPTEENDQAEVYRSKKIGPYYSMDDINKAAYRKTKLLFQEFYKDLYRDMPRTKVTKEEKTIAPPHALPIFTMRYEELKVVTEVFRKIRCRKSLLDDCTAYGNFIWLVKVRSEVFSTNVPGSSTTENEYPCTTPEAANERAAKEYYRRFAEFISEWSQNLLETRKDSVDDDVEDHLKDVNDEDGLFDMKNVYSRTEGAMRSVGANDSDEDDDEYGMATDNEEGMAADDEEGMAVDDEEGMAADNEESMATDREEGIVTDHGQGVTTDHDQGMVTDPQSSTAMSSSSPNLAPNFQSTDLDHSSVALDVPMLDAGQTNRQEGDESQSTNHADNDEFDVMEEEEQKGDDFQSIERAGSDEFDMVEKEVQDEAEGPEEADEADGLKEAEGAEDAEEDEESSSPDLKLKLHVYIKKLKVEGPRHRRPKK